MSNVWFTSDLHLGHVKVAEIRVSERVRSYDLEDKVRWHDDALAANWDAAVKPGDAVWVLGDISSGTNTGQRAALEWIKARPGDKHLISGNHDGTHAMHRDSHKMMHAYLEAFESVQLHARRRIPLIEGHVNALLSHMPYTGDHTEEDRLPQWRLPDRGDYILHGHTHSGWRLSQGGRNPGFGSMCGADPEARKSTFFSRINQIHVGVDAWDFKPVALQTITDTIHKIEAGEIDPALTKRY